MMSDKQLIDMSHELLALETTLRTVAETLGDIPDTGAQLKELLGSFGNVVEGLRTRVARSMGVMVSDPKGVS